MSDAETVLLEHADRIAKLEEQVRELQQQLERLQRRSAKPKTRNSGLWQRLSGSKVELREVLARTLLLLSYFVFFSMILLGPLTKAIEFIPGGQAFWVPVWWTAVFLTCAIGALLFVSSRE